MSSVNIGSVINTRSRATEGLLLKLFVHVHKDLIVYVCVCGGAGGWRVGRSEINMI